jgi:hypothetical protein
MAQLYKADNEVEEKPEPVVEAETTEAKPTEEKKPTEEWRWVIDKVIKETGEHTRRELNGAYHVLPHERFVTQQQDEEVVLLLRAHPITNVGWIAMMIVMLIIPTLLELTGMFNGIPMRFMFVGKMTWYLMAWALGFERFLHWYYSLFIITNERVVDIDFYNLMSRVVTHVNLNHIEEPVMSQHGFGATLFNYGHVLVQTAGERQTVECAACPWPHKVIDIINRLSEELEKRRERGE